MDYVDLQAFGVGIKIDDFDYSKLECEINDKNIMQSCSKFGFLNDKLVKANFKLRSIMYKLCVMALRYDDRIELIFDEE